MRTSPTRSCPASPPRFAAAADFELPLTLRGVSSSMVFTTGHDLKGGALPDWAKLAISGATVAVYMGRSVAADVAARLIDAGLSPDTAVAVVENASLANRRRFHGTLADLPSLEGRDDLTGPVMTIIGDAVAGARLRPLRRRWPPVRSTRPSPAALKEPTHEGAHRQPADRRRSRLVRRAASWAETIEGAETRRRQGRRGTARSDRQGRLRRQPGARRRT